MFDVSKIKPFEKYYCKRKDIRKKQRFCKETDTTIFVFEPNSRTRGYRFTLDDFLSLYTPLVPTQEEVDMAWRKRMKKAIRFLDESDLWPEIKELFQNLLTIDLVDYHKMRDIIFDCSLDRNGRLEQLSVYKEKYPFIFYLGSDGDTCINHDYFYEISQCYLKSMYYGKFENKRIKEEIKSSILNHHNYSTGRIPVNYDVSFEYNADKKKAWYSEEYRNCGNGYYYIALNHNTALFVEKD